MENVRKKRDVKLVATDKRRNQFVDFLKMKNKKKSRNKNE